MLLEVHAIITASSSHSYMASEMGKKYKDLVINNGKNSQGTILAEHDRCYAHN